MKNKLLKKLFLTSLSIALCMSFIQTNAIAAESKENLPSKSQITSQATNLVDIKDGNQVRKDIVISEQDKEAALSGKLSANDLSKKYNLKNKTKTSTTQSSIMQPASTSSTTGSRSLSSFYFLNDSSLYGGDQSLLSAAMGNSTGCGPIAGANILAYHAKYYGRSSLYPYSWYKSDWIKFQDAMYAILGGIQNLSRFNSMVNTYANGHGYRYSTSSQSYVLDNNSNLTSMTSFIKSQIDSNNPVGMLLGTNSYYYSYKTNYSNHWVTITGYDFTNGRTNVTVSSWGDDDTLSLATLLSDRTWIDVTYAYAY